MAEYEAFPPLTDELVRVLYTPEEIDKRVSEIADQINKDYADIKQPMIIVGVLRGSYIFISDLCRKLTVPHIVDFISVSSYGSKTRTSGNVKMLLDTRENQEGKHVLVVEDILDSGFTLNYLNRNFLTRNPLSVRNCVLLDKAESHVVPVDTSYVGFKVSDVWIVGYGMDVADKYRSLPYLAEYNPEANK